MMGGWHHMGRGFMGVGGGSILTMIIWLVLIGGLVFLLIRQFSNKSSNNYSQNNNSSSKDNPLEIAKKRYAKGEIDKDEFQEIKEELND